jgi:outer membrane protein
MKHYINAGLTLVLLSASVGVQAQTAGTMMVKVGYSYFDPQVSSGTMSAPSLPQTKVDVGGAGTLLLSGTYMYTDHISAEFYAGLPLKHNMFAAGSIQGAGVIGTVQQLPPTLFGQYRFRDASAVFRPYVGLGLTYVRFQEETGDGLLTALTNPGGPPTTFVVDNAWGLTPQLGVSYWINSKWYLDASINKSYLKTTTHLSTGQSIDTTLNPLVGQISLGYRF